jgi:hypothetical protein
MQYVRKILISTAVISMLLLGDSFSSDLMACDYYASPNGGGNGSSPSSPFRISNFWSVARPGKTLCLLDGLYIDAIKPPQNLNGTASARITIKALNDGKVRIDGQGARIPIYLYGNDYFVIEGVNGSNGVDAVVKISGRADNNIIRRVCAWDAQIDTNAVVFTVNNSLNNLLEDVCAFGNGRKQFTNSQGGHKTTYRRAWAMWNASTNIAPKEPFQLGYNSKDSTCENCIATWRTTQSSINQAYTLFRAGEITSGTDFEINTQYLGSIGYILADAGTGPFSLAFHKIARGVTYKDVVLYTENNQRPFDVRETTKSTGEPCSNCYLINTTEIGGNDSAISNEWKIQNRVKVETVGAAPNIWNGASSNGARVCNRYMNRALTSTPLWPWPMNQRIIDAMKTAGKTPVDVTKTMENIFGPIPSECRNGNVASAAPAPTATASVPPPPANLTAQ